MAHASVRYAGYGYPYYGIYKTGSGTLALNNSTLSQNYGAGLLLDNSTGTHQVANCVFSYQSEGVRVLAGQKQAIALTDCTIISNSSYGVLNSSTNMYVDARSCWWGYATGPYHTNLNVSGQGNQVSDYVLFNPWRTAAMLGNVRVYLEPVGARTNGAAWSLDGITWRANGDMVANLTPGSYTIQYAPATGYITPANSSVNVSQNATSEVTMWYSTPGGGGGDDGDVNDNGIPDPWEIKHFGNLTTVTSTSDTDGDDSKDVDEYWAETIPTNGASYLGFMSITVNPANCVLEWQSVDGKRYELQRTSNLLQGAWAMIATNLSATAPMNSYTDSIASPTPWAYRLRLE
jgi:hypothetical protein